MEYLVRICIYRRLLISAGVIIVSTAIMDRLEFTHSFWQNHSFATNIACGTLLLLLGFFGVEGWFREREARKWRRVGNISCKELGYSCDVLSNGLEHLLTGNSRSKYGVFLSNEVERTIEQHLRKHTLYNPNQSHLSFQERQCRLKSLLDDSEWADHAQHVLDYLKHLHRDKIGTWMPAMLTTDESIKALDRVAELNECIFMLQHPLRELAQLRGKHPDIENIKQNVLQRWDEVVTKAVKMQEDLMRMAGETDWVHKVGRNRLSPDGLKQVKTTESKKPQGFSLAFCRQLWG